jgi:cobalt-zinc-cadmium efflux system membrane fusion protein
MDMNIQTHSQPKKTIIGWLLITTLLTACSESSEQKQTAHQVNKPQGEVYLAPGSPKKAYVKTASLVPIPHPLLEPLAGKITYNESMTSRISSPVAGRVIASPVTLGTPVKAGATLMELDSPDVATAEADFAKAQADLTLSGRAYKRQQELYAGKAVSRKELEQTEDDLSRARSELQRAQDKLKNLHISSPQNDGRFSLRSAVSGVVVERNVNPGMEVRPELEKPLYVVSDLKKLTVLLEVFEVNLGKIKPGQKLSITVPAYPGEKFPATIEYISQVLDEQTRTVQVRCDLPNPDGRLLPGMYATITVESNPDDKAIVIPLTAVFTEGDSDYVFVALDEDHFQQRPVEIDLRLKDNAVVSSGLQAGDLLVTEGALMLRAEEEIDIENTNK